MDFRFLFIDKNLLRCFRTLGSVGEEMVTDSDFDRSLVCFCMNRGSLEDGALVDGDDRSPSDGGLLLVVDIAQSDDRKIGCWRGIKIRGDEEQEVETYITDFEEKTYGRCR